MDLAWTWNTVTTVATTMFARTYLNTCLFAPNCAEVLHQAVKRNQFVRPGKMLTPPNRKQLEKVAKKTAINDTMACPIGTGPNHPNQQETKYRMWHAPASSKESLIL